MKDGTALKKLVKLLGSRAAYRKDKGAPGAAGRAVASAEFQRLRPLVEAAKAARDARYRELLQDPKYRELVAEHDALRKELQEAGSQSRRYAITAGKDMGLFFSVAAEGDTWPEVLEQLEKKKAEGRLPV